MVHLHYDYHNLFHNSNPNKMAKFFFYILIGILLFGILISCGSRKSISTEKQRDSIQIVEKIKIDTFKIIEKVTVTEPVYNEVNIPCDSTYFESKYQSGAVKYKIIKEKGNVRVVFEKDSLRNFEKELYHRALSEKDSLLKVVDKQKSEKKVVRESFWSGLWKWLFFLNLPFALYGWYKFIIFAKNKTLF